MSKLFLKSIAVITSTLFIATNLSWANLSNSEPLRSEAVTHAQISSIQIPEALGTIQDQHISDAGKPFIVLIQDAHAVTNAQIQIQKLIQYLGEKYGISLAALEGAAGKMDATLLRAFPDGNAKERVLSDYLSRGEITGAEMAAIFNSYRTEFFGIEDVRLYEDNYFAYLSAVKSQKSIFASLEKSKSELDSRRKTIFSEKHNEFYIHVESFRTGKTAILELFKYFHQFDLAKYPNLKKICDLSDQEITKKNIHQISDIKGTELFGEMESFISETENSFCKNQEQKEIVQAYRRNALLHDLASLELTKEEWHEVLHTPSPTATPLSRGEFPSSKRGRHEVRGVSDIAFQPALNFYHLALRRDEVLHQNLNQLLAKQKAKSAIVIAGGFHANGFKEALKKSGFSYAVVTPALRSANGYENYSGLMRGNLSYKQYLKNSLYDAFLKDASVKLARALDARDAAQKIKYWRDEVIRIAAREGRSGDSGKYTRYVDSLNDKTREEILAAVRKVLDSFLAENLGKPVSSAAVSANLSALIQPQAHPLMTQESARLRNFVLQEQSSGNSLGMPAEIKILTDQIKDVNPVTFTQKTQGLKWDSGQLQALRQGINPSVLKPGMKLYGQIADPRHWKELHGRSVQETDTGIAEMIEKGLDHIEDRYRRYFVGRGPEGGDFSWYVMHQILHDLFLSSLTPERQKEFLAIVLKVREKLILRNAKEKIGPEDSRYFHREVRRSIFVFGLNHAVSAEALKQKDEISNLSEIFSRIGQHYLGITYKKDFTHPYDPEDDFFPFFEKMNLRATEEDLNTLLTSLKATGRSLGGEADQTAAAKYDSSEIRAPSEWEVDNIIRYFIERDKFIEGLTVGSLKDEKLLPSIKEAFDDQEAKIFERVREVTTDKETAFPVIVEQAEDMLFGKYHRAYVGMVSVPLVKATEINKTFKLKGFADYFKGVVNKKLSEKSHRGEKLALMEDPEKPQSGYLGGRIVLLNVTPETLGDMLPNVIQEALAEVKKKYKTKILNPSDYESFCGEVESMSFFASHAEVYLPKEDIKGASGDFELIYVLSEIDKIRAANLRDFLKEGKSELNLDEVNVLSISKQRDYYRAYDEYLRDRRKILAASAKYWMTQHVSGVAGARGKASSFIELLLDDGFKKLNERLETLEKTTDKALRDQINQSVGITDAFARIPILDDVAVADIKKNLGSEEAANFFRHIQTGRRKSVPPFNYRTHYFPRLISPLRHIRNPKASEAEQKRTFIKKIQEALSEIEESLKSEPEELEARLNIFKQVYRDYRLAIEEAFLLAYRDPRLEEIYKLFWIDEVIEADRSGALQAWKEHLKQRAEQYPDWGRQREILFNRGALRMLDLEKLIHPGMAVFKRPVGDETGFVMRDSDGNYHVGFAELNNGNAYFEFNTPDSWDSVYHQILQAFLDEAQRYYAVEENRKNPLGFIGNLNERILQVAPQKFPTTVKVESEFPDAFGKIKLDGKKIIERMAAYSLDGETSSSLLPGYAVSRTGDVYARRPFGSKQRWIKTKTVTLDQLVRFESTLSASRVIYSILMNPEKDKILRIFNLLDDLVGYQKQVEELIQKVATSDELEKVKERFDSAGIEIPRGTGRIDRSIIRGLRIDSEEPAEGQSLGEGNSSGEKKPRSVSINPRKREVNPDRLQLFTRNYHDLFRAVLGLFSHQKRAARKSKEGLWEGFFKIIEDGSTVDYAVYLPGQEKPFKYLGEIPRAVMTNAELILIQNIKRATRPGVSTGKKVRPSDDDPAVTKLRPDVARKMENQFRLEWKGIVENLWWLMFNPFSIWPQKVGKPLEDQPHHLTLSRADALISQKDMRRKENLLDAIRLFLDLNDAASIQSEEKFRLAVNGWYHSDAPDAVRAGASQSQAHAHLVRFSFPIERASLLPRLQIRNVDVSELSDGWGSGIALTATRNHMVELVDLLSQTIALITSKGDSFNLITSLSGDGKSIRVFVAVRVKSGPEYFDSEWGFSEFSRVVIIDNPVRFYRMSPEMQEAYSKITDSAERIQWINENRRAGKLSDVNPNLRKDVIKSLNQITAPRNYLNRIFDGLKTANQDEVISEFTPQADSAPSDGKSLGEKLDKIYDDIKHSAVIQDRIESAAFENFVEGLLGTRAELLIPQLQAAVMPETSIVPVFAEELSEGAKFLLANPKILSDALNRRHGINFDLKSNYVIDASFLHQDGAAKFIQALGTSVAVTFASGTPDADLASNLRGTQRVGYGHNNTLDQKKLRGVSNPVLILPSGIAFKFTEGSDWKKRGVEAEPVLVNPYETSEFVRLVEIILQTRKLKDNGVSFPVIDQEMLNSVVALLNNLAKEELTREAIGRAA